MHLILIWCEAMIYWTGRELQWVFGGMDFWDNLLNIVVLSTVIRELVRYRAKLVDRQGFHADATTWKEGFKRVFLLVAAPNHFDIPGITDGPRFRALDEAFDRKWDEAKKRRRAKRKERQQKRRPAYHPENSSQPNQESLAGEALLRAMDWLNKRIHSMLGYFGWEFPPEE